jgi:molybdate transport system substrate-binding protein
MNLTVMQSAAFKEAYEALLPAFEQASGHTVTTLWTPSVDMMSRLKGGEVVDLVIMSAAAIDELIQHGKLAARTDLAKSGVALAVRAGAPQPDISSGDALKRALIAAKSVCYSTGPSGIYLAGLFEKMGIADQIKAKQVVVKGEPAGAVVARGEAEIGFQQMSELLPVAGIDIVGPLSDDVQRITVFSAGVHTQAPQAAAAQALIRHLTAAAAAPVITQSGMQPV